MKFHFFQKILLWMMHDYISIAVLLLKLWSMHRYYFIGFFYLMLFILRDSCPIYYLVIAYMPCSFVSAIL